MQPPFGFSRTPHSVDLCSAALSLLFREEKEFDRTAPLVIVEFLHRPYFLTSVVEAHVFSSITELIHGFDM